MSNFWKDRKIYVSIISAGMSWEDLLKEADTLGLKEVALFLTWVDEDEREKLFKKLEESSIKSIPFVHLRHDVKLEEVEYLIEKFNTKIFNIHPQKSKYPLKNDLSKYRDRIYVENALNIRKRGTFTQEDIDGWAGICMDIAHLEDEKNINRGSFERTMKLVKKNGVGCNHISPFKSEIYKQILEGKGPSSFIKRWHLVEELTELDYINNYPSWIFSNTIALEMTNSIKEQLEAKKYIIELLKDKK